MFATQDTIIKEHSGVATVWLISTLGNKSSYKRITKRDIQAVSIPVTCNVIKHPPSPMTLKLTSNLLYGITLVYKQKTDYLNNDTAAIKTKVQRDLFTQSNNKNLLLKTNVALLNSLNSNNHKEIVSNGQVLLNDDPSFNISTGWLPSLKDLSFLDEVQFAENQNNPVVKRKLEIKKSDLSNNTSTATALISSASQENENPLNRRIEQDDELDTLNPEFAFDEDGILFSLHKGSQEENINGERDNEYEFNYGMDIDFDFCGPDQDMVPLGEMLEDINTNLPNSEEVESANRINPPSAPNLKKKKRKRTSYSCIIVDEEIGLKTEQLRGFRDKYVENMNIKANTKKLKSKNTKSLINDILNETDLFIPKFEKVVEEHRGRSRHRSEEEEDFVDGLMRNRRSSVGSIEIARRGSSSTRRNSQASISAINLPLIYDEDDPNMNYDAANDYYDLDFGDALPFNENTIIEEKSRKKRSSSIESRFESVQEDAQLDFDFEVDEDLDKVPINNAEQKQDAPISETYKEKLRNQELKNKSERRTSKFLNYIETRLFEEHCNELFFDTLLENQKNKSIVVKSFYEVLQLASSNQIYIETMQSEDEKFEILKSYEFKIGLV